MSIDTFGRRQHGVVHGKQLRTVMSEKAIRTRVARGDFVRVHRDVYRVAGAPYTWQSHIMAAVLASLTGATASHETALMLHGLLPPQFRQPHVLVMGRASRRRPGLRIHETTSAFKRIVVDGIPTTTPARAIIDASSTITAWRISQALDDAHIRRLCAFDDVWRELRALSTRGRKGVATLTALLEERLGLQPGAVNELELRAQKAAQSLGLRAKMQYEVQDGPQRFYIDMAIPELRVAIELDGFAAHSARTRFRADRQKQNLLVAEGWTVLRFVWEDSFEQIRDTLAATIAQLAS